MPTIREYLEQVRMSGGTPTFTNISGSPLLQPGAMPGGGRDMGGPAASMQRPGAYFIEEAGGNPSMTPSGMVQPAPKPAIPDRESTQDVMSTSPMMLANDAVKKMMPEIYQNLGIAPGTQMTPAQRVLAQKAVMSMRNALTDHYKFQQDRINKGRESQLKEMQNQTLTAKDKAAMINKFMDKFDELSSDPMTAQQVQGMTAEQYAMQRMQAIEGALGSGGAIPGRSDAFGNMSMSGMMGGYQGAMPNQMPTPDQFQKEANALFAKYGRTEDGKMKVRQELEARYPGIFNR